MAGLPFSGGALGYFGYDLGMRLEGVPDTRPESELPEMAVGLYDWAVLTDHARRRTVWVGDSRCGDVLNWVRAAAEKAPPSPSAFAGRLCLQPVQADYAAAFERVQAYILAGDCYQVNLACPFEAAYDGDPWSAYRRLRRLSPAPFGAYLDLPFAQILSNSPERFLRLHGSRVETRPIKGTRPRRAQPAEDAREREALASSSKDRAENVMIVDLLRNDLGKSCRPGSVEVTELFALESYASVHHLVSAVAGELREGVTAADLLRGCMPGGSITGAPKRRAMEIIRDLEPLRRGAYCGAIGYIGDDGGMDTNIAIRTLVCAEGRARYWAGGGIVADSTADAELQEVYQKAAAFLQLLET